MNNITVLPAGNDSIRIQMDSACDFFPFVSAITNVIVLFQKHVYSIEEKQDMGREDPYWRYIDKKDSLRCILLAIPFINIPVAIYYYFLEPIVLTSSENSLGPINTLPLDILRMIFSYTERVSLKYGSVVNKLFQEAIGSPIVTNSVIYRTEAFGNIQWIKEGGYEIVKNESMEEEFKSLCNFIDQLMQGVFKGKKLGYMLKTGLILRVPNDLTLENLGDLAKPHFPASNNGYKHFYPPDKQKHAGRSVWVYIPISGIFWSEYKAYPEQQKMVADLGCQDSYAREVAAGLFAKFVLSGNKTIWSPIVRCQDTRNGLQSVVGFDSSGLSVDDQDGFGYIEVLGFVRGEPGEVQPSVLG